MMQVRRIKTVFEIQLQAAIVHSIALFLLPKISGLMANFITTTLNSLQDSLPERSEYSIGADIQRHLSEQ